MSYSPEDARFDEWYGELIDHISGDAIAGFQTDRLQSYYLTHPDIARNAVDRYFEAKKLSSANPGAALVLFVTATEVSLKSVLLKPLIHGLVHNDAVADLVADLAISHTGLDRFESILARLLETYGQIDFSEFRIAGHGKTLWENLKQVQRARNGLVHRAEPVLSEDHVLAESVATAIFSNWLPSVLHGLGLKYGDYGVIQRA